MNYPPKQNLWGFIVLGAWVLLTLIVTIRAFAAPEKRTVYPVYMRAADHWISGAELYAGGIDFRYSPPVAAAFVPLRLLPLGGGAALWRLINIAALLGALAWWTRCPPFSALAPERRALLFLLVLPLAANAINNGQVNPLLAALLVASIVAVSFDRPVVASVCLVLAVLLKVYPIILALLLLLCYPRRLTLRLLLAGAVIVGLSFLLQHPSYVFDRYAEWIDAIRTDDRDLWSIDLAPTDMRLLIRRWWGVPPAWAYSALQGVTGLLVAALCLWRRPRTAAAAASARGLFLFHLFGLACCWMLLFGPATESNTFVLAAPAAALLLVLPPAGSLGRWCRFLGIAGYATIVASQVIGWFPFGRDVQSAGIAPLGTLLLFLAFILCLFNRSAAPAGAPLAEPAIARV